MTAQTVRTGRHRRTIEAAQYSNAIVNYPVHGFLHSPSFSFGTAMHDPAKQPTMEDFTAPLAQVLNQSEHIKNVVEECAQELSSINAILKQDINGQLPSAELERALTQSEIVESKVEECAKALSSVNKVLAEEIDARRRLEHDLAAIKEQEEKTRSLAFQDPLTGLSNRALFNERLVHGMAQAMRHHWYLAVMFVDLDDFKTINDSYGHDAGDKVLRFVAQRLRDSIRNDDTVGRHGGDEFMCLFLEIRDESHIGVMARAIVNKIKEPCHIDGISVVVSPSIGISMFPKDGTGADALIKSADEAMYDAKRNKTGYSFFSRISRP